MSESRLKWTKLRIARKSLNGGYALIDVLAGILIFGIGFAAACGLWESAAVQSRDMQNYLEAANLAQKLMDTLESGEKKEGLYIPGETVEGAEGRYHWQVESVWEDMPSLLRVKITVLWEANGYGKSYRLESLYYVD